MSRFIAGTALFFLLSASAGAPAAFAQHLTASGCSVSNIGYLSDLARDYEKETGVKILVRGGGSVIGLDDLRSGKVDFAASCRERTAGDPGGIEFVEVARDALVFIVHKSNPVDDISLDAVRAVYAGKITNWKQLKGGGSPIKIFISRSRSGLSGVESSTKKMVLNGNDPAATPDTLFLASTGIVEQMVEKTPEGFASTGFSSARKRNVRILRLNGRAPSKENIASGSYPLGRPLFLVYSKKVKPEVRKFIDFALSARGQKLIGSYGVVPLSAAR